MKKIIKIGCIVVISILVLWLSLYLVDNARYRKGNKPLFTLKTKNYLFFDGKVTEYDSLLYKMIVYNRKSMKETSFKAICLTSILVVPIGFSNLVNMLYPIFGVLGLVQIFKILRLKH